MGALFAVYGATGTTGSLVVAELLRRGLAHLALPRDLRRARAAIPGDARVCIINCAGPFADTAVPVEELARDIDAPAVVHICGSRSDLRALFARDETLASAGLCVVGGAGFSSTVAELASWLAVKGLPRPLAITTIHGAVASVPSAGSLQSYLRDVDSGQPHGDVRVVELPQPVGARAVRRVDLAEGLTLRRGIDEVREVASYLAVGPPRTAALNPLPYVDDRAALQRMIEWRATQPARGPTVAERGEMGFVVRAIATSIADQTAAKHVDVVGVDPYGLTALLAVEVALRAESSPKPGARAPLELLDAQAALALLARAGVRWAVRSGA